MPAADAQPLAFEVNKENMGILKCEFKARTETLGSELVGKEDVYRSPKYEIVSHERNILIVKIFSSLAIGVRYSSWEQLGSGHTKQLTLQIKWPKTESETALIDQFSP